MSQHSKIQLFWSNFVKKYKFFYPLFFILWISTTNAWGVEFLSPTVFDAKKTPIATDEYIAFPVIKGVPLYWNGTQFEDKQGTLFLPPAWFAQALKQTPLVGMLVGKEADSLETITRILRQPDAQAAWERLYFIATDIPQQGVAFTDRWKQLSQLVSVAASPYLQQQFDQQIFTNIAALQSHLDTLYKKGGDGLILKKANANYTDDNLALILALPYTLDEAIVFAHRSGQGEFSGMMGSLEVESINGDKFVIGTGFSHHLRKNPPPIGSYIAYKYKGFTATGKPKNPVFLKRLHKQKKPPLIGGFLSTTVIGWVFTGLMLLLTLLDSITHWRRGRHLDFKSAIVSIGLLGTFVGIWWGLYNFNTDDIASGVPALLDGLKFAFVTSIIGMALSMLLSVTQTIIGDRDSQHVE